MPAVDIDRVDAASLATLLSRVRHAIQSNEADALKKDEANETLDDMRQRMAQFHECLNTLCRDIKSLKPSSSYSDQ